jgi:glucose-1-phosphate cytidylyltransferase
MMKTVILCGGMGTRLSEETSILPKPMVEVGGYPILWHIMRIYATWGFKEFVLAVGYKGEVIKDHFINYHPLQSDVTVDLKSGRVSYANSNAEDWTVRIVDTGAKTLTGGRLHRLEPILRPHGTFMLTYGDGVANLDVKALVTFHRRHRKLATVTSVRPQARFGGMVLDGEQVVDFKEKPQTGEGWINGGFFVFEPGVFQLLNDDTVLEADTLERLAAERQLMAYRHDGFWQCMDTLRDKKALDEMWATDRPGWKIW